MLQPALPERGNHGSDWQCHDNDNGWQWLTVATMRCMMVFEGEEVTSSINIWGIVFNLKFFRFNFLHLLMD